MARLDSRDAPVVRPALTTDADAIGLVNVRAWRVAYRGQISDEYLDSLDPAKRALKWKKVIVEGERTILVTEGGAAVVGFCSLARSGDDDLAGQQVREITAIYVDPDHWREGHGRALMSAARLAAKRAGFESLSLWALRSNGAARAFYQALGFELDGAEKTDTQFGIELREIRYRSRVDLKV